MRPAMVFQLSTFGANKFFRFLVKEQKGGNFQRKKGQSTLE